MIFDPMYLLMIAPAMLLALWAQWKVRSTYRAASQVPSQRGLSGAEAARAVLDANGLDRVGIERTHGHLSDHYDPRDKVLRLSDEVYEGRNLAALGIAAHEAGHAVQDAQRYGPLAIRNAMVPLAATGGQLSMLFIIGGAVLMAAGAALGQWVMFVGIGLFSLAVFFQVVNLPVEFDASRRAKLALVNYGIVPEAQMGPVRSVLSAAAMTYVAATATAIAELAYWLLRAGVLGGRDE